MWPANELGFMEGPTGRTAPLERCGPYFSERAFLKALVFMSVLHQPLPAYLAKFAR